MTTSDTSTPITEAALEGELEILRDEIAITERQLEDLRAQREAARAAEHEIGEAVRAATAIYLPLLHQTKQDDQQDGIYGVGEYANVGIYAIGDVRWESRFPEAAAAWHELEVVKQAARTASGRTIDLHKAVLDVEKRKLPALRIAAHDKEAELAAYRTNQQRALETRDATLKDTLDRFRRRLREKA